MTTRYKWQLTPRGELLLGVTAGVTGFLIVARFLWALT